MQRLVVLEVAVEVAGEGGIDDGEAGVEELAATIFACEVFGEKRAARDAAIAGAIHGARRFRA